MKKRLTALFLAAAMAASLVACGQPAASTPPAASSPAQSQPAVSTPSDPAPEVPEEPAEAPLMEYPKEFQTWDESGKNIDIARLGTAENGMAVSLRYEASQVGSDILEAGGNAVDAAVAVALATTVTLPNMCGLAGGGFMTYYSAETGETVFLSFREQAPQYQTAEMWVEDANGNIIGSHKMYGGLAAGVPGEVAGLYYALQEYGTMEWADVIQPAIDLAREGYIATPALITAITDVYEVMNKSKELSEIYLNDEGLPPAIGDVITNEYMARALEIVRDKGPEGFYTGPIADAMVKAVQGAGGLMTQEDLANYECWEDEPAVGHYRGYTIYSTASPSSGGTFIAETLNIMENLPVQEFNSLEYWHQLAEVQKMVWVDRAEYSGDTRFVDVPTSGITSADYAKTLAAQFDPSVAQNFSHGNPWEYDTSESKETTSFSVADKDGNMVSITHTLNYSWGSRVYVDGYGFFMNNQLDDFVAGSGFANSLEPNKSPLSSMSPTVVIDPDGKPFMTCGAPGGVLIYPAIAQVIMNAIDYGMNIDESINAPRIAGMSSALYYSKELSPEIVQGLKDLGHTNLVETGSIALPSGIMYVDGGLEGSVESNYDMETYTDGAAVGY